MTQRSLLFVSAAVAGLLCVAPTLPTAMAEVNAARPRTEYRWENREPVAAFSRTLFLNNCKPLGCNLKVGNTNSMSNSSTIPERNSTLTAYEGSDANWQQVVTCIKEVFSPFNIEITTQDPGSNPHMEVMIAGEPGDLQLSTGIGGIAPFTCGYIDNALSFAFANVYNGDVDEICATAAQEIAHTWGLEHLADASDPMTYFPFDGRRYFKNVDNQCGSDCVDGRYRGRACTGPELQYRNCECSGQAKANSVEMIRDIFGASTPMPPVVTFTAPRDGDKVQAGAPVRVTVQTELRLSKAELRIDGVVGATLNSEPYAFNLPATTAPGTHVVEVVAYDIFELPGSAKINVELIGPCETAADCSDGQTCVGKRCVAGPGTTGGLGETCANNVDCGSNRCGDDGSGNKYCVEACTLGSTECPNGFDCLQTGNTGVCWPNGGSTDAGDGGGCATAGNQAAMPVVFGLGLLMFAGRRRRQPRVG